MKVKLTKLIGGEYIRTSTVDGEAECLPVVGRPFFMFAESVAFEGGVRIVNTSDVQNITIDDTGSYILETLNSTYKLSIQ